jgi:hypothetical protein
MVDLAEGKADSGRDRRPIGVLLMIGLLVLPLLFGWLLLRPGYANSTRIVVAVYALMMPALTLIANLGQSLAG